MLFFKTSDKAIQIYYLSLSAVIITVTGWIFSTCNLPTPPQQIHQFFKRILKSCKQVKFFKVLSWVLLKLGRLPPQIVQLCSLTIVNLLEVLYMSNRHLQGLPINEIILFAPGDPP